MLAARDHDVRRGKLVTLRRFLLVHAAIAALVWTARDPQISSGAIAAGLVIAAAVGLLGRAARATTAVAAALVLAQMIARFPRTANHELLALACLSMLALIDESLEEESALGEQALRCLVPIVFVWSGIQKLLSGCWLEGELLAVSAIEQDRFFWLRLLVPRSEMAALEALAPSSIGSGPFHFESAIPLACSNAVWILELLLPLLLLVRRTRAIAAVALLVLLAAIELIAREVLFGGLAACLIALHLEGENRLRVTVAILLPIYLVYLGAALA